MGQARSYDAPPAAHLDGRPPRGISARWIALMAATAIALYLCWLMLRPFVEVLLWATVLAIVFYPLHQRILRRTQSPSWSAVLSCLLVAATILIPLTFVAVSAVNEAANAVEGLKHNAGRLFDKNAPLVQWVHKYVVDVEPYFKEEHFSPATVQDELVEPLRGMLGPIFGRTWGVVKAVFVTLLKIFFVVFTMYYFFRDGERVKNALQDALPLEHAQSQQILARTREVISASVDGVLVIAAIQGVLGGLAFWLLGLPSPLLWGVVMFFLSMIPLGGAAIVWIPAALFLFATGHWVKAIILIAWGGGVIGMADNLLRPRLVGNRTRLHELIVFFSVVGGLQVFGVLGLVVGPVVVAITLALLDVFRKAERPAALGLREPTLIEAQAALRNVPRETAAEVPASSAAALASPAARVVTVEVPAEAAHATKARANGPAVMQNKGKRQKHRNRR